MYYSEHLEHHGILGQKWGVRRFQNKDGTRTAAGKAREREGGESSGERSKSASSESSISESSGQKKGLSDKQKKALIIGGAAVAAGAFLIANPTTRNALAKYGKTKMSALNKENLTKTSIAIGKKAGRMAARVEDAMIDAALASIGGIAIAKISEQLKPADDATEFEKNVAKVKTDAIAGGIRAATKANKSGGGNNNNNGGGASKEAKDKIGEPPSKNSVDRQSKEWADLFKDESGNQRDSETRRNIKQLANEGYDIDQINKYLNHADFEDWTSKYMAVEIGW